MGKRFEGIFHTGLHADVPFSQGNIRVSALADGWGLYYMDDDEDDAPSFAVPIYGATLDTTRQSSDFDGVADIRPPLTFHWSVDQFGSRNTLLRGSPWFTRAWGSDIIARVRKEWTTSADDALPLAIPTDSFPTAVEVGDLPEGATLYYGNIRDRQQNGTAVQDTWDIRAVYEGWNADFLAATPAKLWLQAGTGQDVEETATTATIGRGAGFGPRRRELGVPNPFPALIAQGKTYIRDNPTVYQRFYKSPDAAILSTSNWGTTAVQYSLQASIAPATFNSAVDALPESTPGDDWVRVVLAYDNDTPPAEPYIPEPVPFVVPGTGEPTPLETRYVAEANDRLDRIAFKVYGNQDDATLRTLVWANPGLRLLPSIPAGTPIETPPVVPFRFQTGRVG